MLFFPVFAKLQPRSAIPTRSESAKLQSGADARNAGFSGLTPFIATHPKNWLVTPFIATLPKSLDLKSFVCHTSAKEGGSPLSGHAHPTPLCFSCFQESLKYWRFDPVKHLLSHSSRVAALRSLCAPRAQNRRAICAFFRNNSFACHTSVFHGGEGVYPARLSGTSPLLPAGRRFPPSHRGGPSRNRRLRPCRRVSTRLEGLLSSTSHESPVTVSPRRTIAPKRPQCHNGFERRINATPGNISARPGV
jgi:hypothetical protein